jgi:hypothetical protein
MITKAAGERGQLRLDLGAQQAGHAESPSGLGLLSRLRLEKLGSESV